MTDLATLYANLGKAYLDLADAIDTAPTRAQDAPGATVAPSFDDLPPDDFEPDPLLAPHIQEHARLVEAGGGGRPRSGSASVCPAHNIEYRSGRYGSYCPSTSDDPKWSNEKGYCTVTPKNAAAWLRQHA